MVAWAKYIGGINVSIKDAFEKNDKRDYKLMSSESLIFHEELERILVKNEVENEAKLKEQEAKLGKRMIVENEAKLKEHEAKFEE